MARAPGTETDARGADGGIMADDEKVKSRLKVAVVDGRTRTRAVTGAPGAARVVKTDAFRATAVTRDANLSMRVSARAIEERVSTGSRLVYPVIIHPETTPRWLRGHPDYRR